MLPPWQRLLALSTIVAGLGCIGLAHLHPALAGAAWLGVVLAAFGLSREPDARRRALAVLAGAVLCEALLAHWGWRTFVAYFGMSIPAGVAACTLAVLIRGCAEGAPIALATRLLPRLPVLLVVPIGWALGEAALFAVTHLSIDWLATQWTTTPVLRLLGRVGHYPTLLACLVAAAAVGEAIARRRALLLVPAAVVGILFVALPPLPEADLRLLEHVGAVHAVAENAPPLAAPDGLELIVWPEGMPGPRLRVAEGRVHHRVDPPLRSTAVQLEGADTLRVGGIQNAALVVEPDGQVTQMRAKRVLIPPVETSFIGYAPLRDYLPGTAVPLVDAAGRKVVPVLCAEALSREVIADGVAAGGELIAVLASDRLFGGDPTGLRLSLAALVMRAVEFRRPAVRATLDGYAAFVAPDGRVLGVSESGRSGVLVFRDGRVQDHDATGVPVPVEGDPSAESIAARRARLPPAAPPSADQVVVLSERRAPHLRTHCPPGRCAYVELDDLACDPSRRAEAVILAGHAAPPLFLGRSASELARAARCFSPSLVVVDACWGSDASLLRALADPSLPGPVPLVVAAPVSVRHAGFSYDDAFFAGGSPEVRAAAVHPPRSAAALRWRPELAALDAAQRTLEDWPVETRRQHLRGWDPALVGVPLEGAPGEVLFPVDWRELGSPPRRARPTPPDEEDP